MNKKDIDDWVNEGIRTARPSKWASFIRMDAKFFVHDKLSIARSLGKLTPKEMCDNVEYAYNLIDELRPTPEHETTELKYRK